MILLALPLLLMSLPATAQETTATLSPGPSAPSPGTAAAIAAKEEAEERGRRLAADLQSVQADNEALHSKITSMEQEIQSLREAVAHSGDNSANQDAFKRLAEKIEEVDKKRLEDKDVISEEIRKAIGGLKESITATPAAPHESRPRPPASQPQESTAAVNGYSYTIADGDRLDLIVKAYNKDFVSKGLKRITMKQAKEANPNVDWNRLKVGQKIVIPRPDGG